MVSLKVFCIFAVATQSCWFMVHGTNGVDVSTSVSVDKWRCIKRVGNSFAIIRVYQSDGQVDPNGAATIKNAKKAGIQNVDGYIFPCFKNGNPAGQIQALKKHLDANEANIGVLWIDVEEENRWSNSKKKNLDFIDGLVDEAKKAKIKVAMYTSQSQWQAITGDSKKFGDLQLWYAHYDNNTNFSDFKPFGGWTKPAMKQYQKTTTVCGVGVDKNWYP